MTDQTAPTRPSAGTLDALTPACAWVRAQAASLALGILDDHDASRVYDHLLLCPACDQAIQRLVGMTALIGLVAPPLTPPAAARAELLRRVAKDREGPPRGVRIAAVAASRRAVPARPRWRPPAMSGQWLAPMVVVALLLFGGLGIQSAVTADDKVALLQQQKASLEAHLATLGTGGRQTFGEDALLYSLMLIEAGETGAGGLLLGDPVEPRASLSVWNLDGRPGQYHVTLEGMDGTRADAGALTVDRRGAGTLDLALFAPILSYRVVHVASSSAPEVDIFTLRLDQSPDLLQQLGE